jgi:hypothetical protein
MTRLLLVPLALAACQKTDSSDILTSGVYADLSAVADGTSTDVSATLFLGEPIHLTYLDLNGDDHLIASHASEHKDMVESIVLNVVSHHATFASSAQGDAFTIAFERSVDGGAPSSVATLPAGFTLAGVAGTQSRAAELTFSWLPGDTGDAMSWQALGDCIELEGSSITGDTGTATIAPNTLKKRMGDGIADQCTVTLTVTRSHPGELDAGYGKGGQISGQQRRSVTFTSTP